MSGSPEITKGINALRTISVSVDTEEEGLWGGAYPVRNCSTTNLRGLPRFQSLCERYSVPPTYLIDAPVLDDQNAINALSGWREAGVCEIGTHCHPWCNPPIVSDTVSRAESYLCNLPEELQYEKLRWLTERIADTFGRSPTSYRAGRYGFDASTVTPLVKLGYQLDSSVLPTFDYRPTSGPSFIDFPRYPSFVLARNGSNRLLEIPITTGFTASGAYRFRQRIRSVVETKWGRKIKLASIANRLGISRLVKLSPEGTSFEELKGLVRSSIQAGVNHLVLMLHSTSLLPGYSPYAKDFSGVEALYDRLERILNYATKQHSCVGITLSEIPDLLPIELPQNNLA